MTTAAGYFDRKPSSTIRPGLSHLQQDPSSPHTPQRTFSSAFSSPSISYRAEEDALVFDFGTRHFSAGFAGEPTPRCTLGFGPEESRRVGDYRRWLPGYKKIISRQEDIDWGREHELWRMDLREVDLGLVEDKIERAVREAYNKYLLLDVKSRRILLVLPSVLPHQLLSSILSTVFVNFQNPSITLYSHPIVHTAAAGCRSSLVVDIGWSETTVTAVYEYREVQQSRSARAMKRVTVDMVKMLQQPSSNPMAERATKDVNTIEADFDIAEEITTRMAWCLPTRGNVDRNTSYHEELVEALNRTSIAEDPISQENPINVIPSPFNTSEDLSIPFSSFAIPVESALLATSHPRHTFDDEEQPLPILIFNSLLRLPPDVRAICMSYIIITGGGSNIPGLKCRLLNEVSTLFKERGWDPVQGKAAEDTRKKLREISLNRNIRPPKQKPKNAEGDNTEDDETPRGSPTLKPSTSLIMSGLALAPSSASQQPQTPDPIQDKLRKARMKGTKPIASGVIRGVESLGAWAGGSLLANLRVRGVVEIDRDTFLAQGLTGARKSGDGEKAGAQLGRGIGAEREREKGGLTLGGWF